MCTYRVCAGSKIIPSRRSSRHCMTQLGDILARHWGAEYRREIRVIESSHDFLFALLYCTALCVITPLGLGSTTFVVARAPNGTWKCSNVVNLRQCNLIFGDSWHVQEHPVSAVSSVCIGPDWPIRCVFHCTGMNATIIPQQKLTYPFQ